MAVISETIILFGRRYRLMPPGEYRSGAAWWVDWHDDAGKRQRVSSWTPDFDEAKRFAYNIASGMDRRAARSQNGYSPASPKVAREIARNDAEAALIRRWLPAPIKGTTTTPAEVIGEAIAEMPPEAAIRLLRRIIDRLKRTQDAAAECRQGQESGDRFGGRNLEIGGKNGVSALAAGPLVDRKTQVNTTS